MGDDFPVTLSAGSFRADPERGWVVPHTWTEAGAVVEAAPNGAGVLHVAVALCVLNEVAEIPRALRAGMSVERADG